MDFFEAVRKRHSYRDEFTGDEVPREDLVKIVDAGIRAPSGKNSQTTDFVIVTDREKLEKIASLHPIAAMRTARAMIACVMDREPEPIYHGMHFQVEDCAAAVENMLLAITALGYASVWIDGALRVEGRAEAMADILSVPPHKTVRIILPIGRPVKQVEQRERKPFDERAWFDTYKG